MFVRRIWPSTIGPIPDPARVWRDMERLFEVMSAPAVGPAAGVFPPLNITRGADRLYARAELPGVKVDELQLSVQGNQLSLSGSREIVEKEGASYHRRERASGSFDRSITLPAEIDEAGVEARYADGILTITLPIATAARARQITVQTT